MLEFDYMCKRKKPSLAGMISPFSSNHYIKVSLAGVVDNRFPDYVKE